jgi:3-mercaptopropionate dioxygenase
VCRCRWTGFIAPEHEERFDADLNLLATNENEVGHVSGFARHGDIHRVPNLSDITAISIHVYETDLSRVGPSAGRCYE